MYNIRCPERKPYCRYQAVYLNVQCSHGVAMQHIHSEADAEGEANGDVEVDADGLTAEGRQMQRSTIPNLSMGLLSFRNSFSCLLTKVTFW